MYLKIIDEAVSATWDEKFNCFTGLSERLDHSCSRQETYDVYLNRGYSLLLQNADICQRTSDLEREVTVMCSANFDEQPPLSGAGEGSYAII